LIRRLVDIAVAVVGLLLGGPLLLLLALCVRLDSPGPAFYGGARAGKAGRPFRIWKFRTMVVDADRAGPGITGHGDPRVTRLGRFLRASKLDELPQLWNLLRGELTLVGPRAEDPRIVERYTAEQRELLRVAPGITGPGAIHFTTDQQVSMPPGVPADEYYVEHLLGPKLELDLDYLRRRSLGLDLRILAGTIRIVLAALLGRTP